MRLSEEAKKVILSAVSSCFSQDTEIWLFGSRCDPSAKGGDIDLLIETPLSDNLFQRKMKLLLALEDLLGEQKIDLVVRNKKEALLPMHQLAKEKGILLR